MFPELRDFCKTDAQESTDVASAYSAVLLGKENLKERRVFVEIVMRAPI